MKRFKFSKTYVAAFLYRFAFLLFVPFLQGLLFAHRGALTLITLYGTDLLVAMLLLSVAVIRCSKAEVIKTPETAEAKGGAVFRTHEKNLLKKRGSIVLSQGIFLRLFGATRLRIYSGNVFSTAFLKKKDAESFLQDFLPDKTDKTLPSGIFRSLLMSVSFSNALTGLLAAVPLIRRASAVLGARQTALILQGASLQGLLSFTGLPPVLTRISSLLLFCWIIGAATEFFGEYGLKVNFYKENIKVTKGLIVKTKAVFAKSSVRALIFRQSLMMFLLGLYSCEARLNIRPRQKIHILSAAARTKCADLEDRFFCRKNQDFTTLYPPKSAIIGYTYLPLIFFSASSLGLIIFTQSLIVKTVLGIFAGISAVWFLFRVVAFFRSSLSFCKEFAEIRCFSGMNFTRCVFKFEDVIEVKVSKSLFQRFNGRCNLLLKIGNTHALKVKIKHLRESDVSAFLQNNYV